MTETANNTTTEPAKRTRKPRAKPRNFKAELADLQIRVNLACELAHKSIGKDGTYSALGIDIALAMLERPAGVE